MQRVLHHQERLNKVFIFSIIISFVVHIAAVLYLERFFDFKPQRSKIKTQNVKQFSFKKPEEGQVLAITFDQKEQLKRKTEKEQTAPQLEKIQDVSSEGLTVKFEIKSQPKLEKIPSSNFSFSSQKNHSINPANFTNSNSSNIENLLVKDSKLKNQYKFQAKLEDKALLSELKAKVRSFSIGASTSGDKEIILTAEIKGKKSALHDVKIKSSFVKPVLLSSVAPILTKGEGILFLDEAAQENQFQSILKKMKIIESGFVSVIKDFSHELSHVQAYVPTLKDLKTYSFGYNFDLELEYAPRKEGGYIFTLTLIPKKDLALESFSQNFYFVIDRSNSVQNKRFASTRYAVAAALNALPKQDRFNLFLFDSTLDFLFRNAQKSDKEAKSQAKKFLIGQKLGSFFSAPSYSLPFNEIVASKNQFKKIDNIIFITDGEGLKRDKNQTVLRDFTRYNQGKRPLHILALEGDANATQLELYANLNKGKLITSFTPSGLKKQLVKLIKSLAEPQIQCLSVNCFPSDKKNEIRFFPFEKGSYLYQNQPFVLVGIAKNLSSFNLFLQGQSKDGWVNVKKEVNLAEAKEGDLSLERLWNLRQAVSLYKSYLVDKDVKKLKRSQKLLEQKL